MWTPNVSALAEKKAKRRIGETAKVDGVDKVDAVDGVDTRIANGRQFEDVDLSVRYVHSVH
jgi:hypothetical protein